MGSHQQRAGAGTRRRNQRARAIEDDLQRLLDGVGGGEVRARRHALYQRARAIEDDLQRLLDSVGGGEVRARRTALVQRARIARRRAALQQAVAAVFAERGAAALLKAPTVRALRLLPGLAC